MIRTIEPAPEPRKVKEDQPGLEEANPLEFVPVISDLGQTAVEEVEIKPSLRLIMLSEPRSPGADRFRYLRMRLRELSGKGRLKSLVITSPNPQDGKSTVVMNLATALAEEGRRQVLVIEADLYRPSVAKGLGIPTRPGLAECLEGALDPVLALRRLEPLKWYLLQAGTPQGNPSEILQSGSMTHVMATLTPLFDWVLIDTPPVAPLTDALGLAQFADACLLVLRADRTPREAVEEALALLGPGRVAGLIFNGAEDLNRLYGRYSEYYGVK